MKNQEERHAETNCACDKCFKPKPEDEKSDWLPEGLGE